MPSVSKLNLCELSHTPSGNKEANNRDCFLGVKNADENELRSIATDPDNIHMFNVADFSFLLEIVDNLSDNLCNSVKGPGMSEFGSYLADETKESNNIMNWNKHRVQVMVQQTKHPLQFSGVVQIELKCY